MDTPRLLAALLLVAAALAPASPASAPPAPGGAARPSAEAPPAWFREHVRARLAHGGRWIASNAAYRGPGEPYEAYGLEWTAGIDGASLRGRLFGLVEGRAVATFWELRTFWHPGEGRAVALQFGADGTFAEGTLLPAAAGGVELEQVFCAPDGSRREVRHEETEGADGETLSLSLRRDPADPGAWAVDRSYRWRPAEDGAEQR